MLAYIITFILALIPSFFWLLIYRWEDREHPEPKSLILRVFIIGAAMAFLIIAVEGALWIVAPQLHTLTWLNTALGLAIFTAVIEEVFKMTFAREVIWRKNIIESILDGAMYSISLALGLAAVENFFYFGFFLINGPLFNTTKIYLGLPTWLSSLSTLQTIILVFLARFLFTTLMHTITSGIVGLHLGKAYFKQENWRKIIDQGLFWAILLHASFNYLAIIGKIELALVIVVLAAIYFFQHLRTKQNLQMRRSLNSKG